jgi:hypothetical protein
MLFGHDLLLGGIFKQKQGQGNSRSRNNLYTTHNNMGTDEKLLPINGADNAYRGI